MIAYADSEVGKIVQHLRTSGMCSHWRDCHFTDALSQSLLKHLLKVEGGAAE